MGALLASLRGDTPDRPTTRPVPTPPHSYSNASLASYYTAELEADRLDASMSPVRPSDVYD